MTEASPVMSANPVNRAKIGTVGTVLPGGEFKIASDGEILYRGPNVMKGYWKNDAATAEMIDADGWLHTGDVGTLDGEGYLKITDRKKDILVLANGKNVAPQPIEARLKASPYIAQAVLFGDREPQVVALLVPEFDHLKRWAREKGIEAKEPEELIAAPEVKKLFRGELERLTADCADFEKVRRFTLLPRDFSADRDEITPTLKIKRRVIAKNYAGEIQSMYGGKD
jgi:long-chain acyl-CoA synthetase